MPAPPSSPKEDADKAPVVSLEHTFPGVTVDVEDTISGPGAFAVYPVTDKKHRLRPCYIVVRRFILELHKTLRDVEICRPAAHNIDLRLVFNACIIKEMASVKDECICVMSPAETYYIELDPKHFKLHVFFNMIIERCREARGVMLVREVSLAEYFEASWDVICLKRPKVKRADVLNEVENPDILIKNPQLCGRFRLVPKPGIIFLFKMNIPPKTILADGTYPRDTYYELSLNSVATYGRSEKYFFIQIGRYSEFGHGELWMECESSMSTKYIHERIDTILQNQSERRRETGNNQSYAAISQHALKSRMHRQRSSRNEDSPSSEPQNKDQTESSNNKTNSKEDLDHQQTEKRSKGVMGAIRKAFKGDDTPKEKSKFGGLFGRKKKKDEPSTTKVSDHSFEVTKVYGDTQEDYMEYYHNDDLIPNDVKSSSTKSMHAPREYCTSAEDPGASRVVPPAKTKATLEYFYPVAESSDGSNITVRLEKNPKKSLSVSIDDGMLSSKNEPRTYSLGSKPTQLNRHVIPKTSSGTHLQQPQAESATGSMNTVESIVEEQEDYGDLSMSDSEDEIDKINKYESCESEHGSNHESEGSGDESKHVNENDKQLNNSDAFTPPLLTVDDKQCSSTDQIEQKPCSSTDQIEQKPPTPIHLSAQNLNTPSKTPEKESEDSITDMIDLNEGALRIRAHSLGSRTLITSANLRKIAGKQGRQPTKEEIERELLRLEMPSHRERTGSSASSDSKNMYSTRYRSKFGTKKSAGDLMELEFSERRHTESLDSSANRSRNSSLGFKSPEIKTALDKVLVNKKNNSDYDECQPPKQTNTEELKSDAGLKTEKNLDNNLEEKTALVTDLDAKTEASVEQNDPDEYEQAIIALTKKAEDEKLKQSQLDADYVMMGTSPETPRKFTNIAKDLKDSVHQPSNVTISPETRRRRHRDKCKKKELKTPMRDRSVNSSSSDEPALNNYDSDDSMGRFDRSSGMIITKNEPVIYDSIIHQSTMRPISRSMNANSHYLSYHHSSKAEGPKDLSEREIRIKEDALLAELAALQKRRLEDHSPSRKHSNVIPPFHRHYSVGQQSARLLRSPSPKSIGGRTAPCTTPGCTLCQDGTGRPRTSFIDSAVLLASPISSRKHSTIVQPLSRSRVNSTASRKKVSAPRKQSSTGQFPTYGYAEEETSNVIKRDRQYSHSVSPKNLDYKPVRKMATVATRKLPMNFNMLPLNIKKLTETESAGRQRVDSVTSRKSAHCRRHRRLSFKQDRQSAKEPRTRSYPAPIFGHVDYAEVELIDPTSDKKKKKCKRKERSPSERPYRMF